MRPAALGSAGGLLFLVGIAHLAEGQRTQPASPASSTATPGGRKVADSVGSHTDTVTTEPPWKRYSLRTFTSGVYDSNIGRDISDATQSTGSVFGVGGRYQTARIRPGLILDYEIARHAYTHSEEFDRISHHLIGVESKRLTKKLIVEAIEEVAIRGSSEDRDVGNQFVLLPRINYRVGSSQRLRAYGAFRIRRYDVDTDRNAINRYVGLEARNIFSNGEQLEYGYRYEVNSAKGSRRSYTRRTYYGSYLRQAGRNDQLLAELRYLSQRYDKRPITVGTVQTPRYDRRISPAIELTHRFSRALSLVTNYDFEHRTSNDPRRGYDDHVLTLTARYDW